MVKGASQYHDQIMLYMSALQINEHSQVKTASQGLKVKLTHIGKVHSKFVLFIKPAALVIVWGCIKENVTN